MKNQHLFSRFDGTSVFIKVRKVFFSVCTHEEVISLAR